MTEISYAQYRAMRRFPALDGLRAIAAVIVIAFHFGGPSWAWTSGWAGVQLFFVLSGFLITTLLLREEEGRGRVSLRSFYIRRSFRILPVYFVVLAATYALAHLNGKGATVSDSMPHYLLMVNEFAPTLGYLHSWTIAIEWKFYLAWPLLAFVLAAGAARRRLTVTLLAIAGLGAMIPFTPDWPYWPVHYVSILLGCLLAIVMHHPRGYALVRPLTRPVVALAVSIGFVAAHLSLHYWPATEHPRLEVMIAGYSVAVALLLPAMLAPGLPKKLLSWRPLVFVGERSYSLYLVQQLAVAVVVGLVPSYETRGTRLFVAATVVALLTADLLYRWVEQPMIQVGRRLSASGRVAPTAPVVASAEPAAPADRSVPHLRIPGNRTPEHPEPAWVPDERHAGLTYPVPAAATASPPPQQWAPSDLGRS